MLEALLRLDYLEIEASHGPHLILADRYLWIRASIVLGKYPAAADKLRRWGTACETSTENQTWVKRFLEWQLLIYQKPVSREANELAEELERELPQDDYWRAEFCFVRGYHLGNIDEYRKEIRYQRSAFESYGRLGLHACQAHALFNLCINYDHLNEPTLLDITFRQLEKVYDERKCEASLLPLMRMRAYRHIHREELEAALDDCLALLPLCREQGRSRDLGSIICLTLYILIKLENYEKLNAFLNVVRPEIPLLTELHQMVVHELLALEQRGLVSGADSRALFIKWKRMGIRSVHLLFLLNLVMDRLLRGRDYVGLIKTARLGSEYSLKKEQALCLVDFRYYEILGLVRSGQFDAAATLLIMYSDDANRDRSEPKQKKISELEKEISLARERANWLAGSSFSSSLILSVSSKSAYYRGKKIDLSQKPVVQKLLDILIRRQAPVPLADLFTEIYAMDYNPLRHDRRLHSLIDRTRRLFGNSSVIVREEGKLSLDPTLLARSESLPPTDVGALTQRRGQILKSIHACDRPLTISELEKLFPCSRRTLQFDLKSLVQSNLIRTTGGTRSRTYYIEKN